MRTTYLAAGLGILFAAGVSVSAAETKAPKQTTPQWETGSMAEMRLDQLDKELQMDEKKRTQFHDMFHKFVQERRQATEALVKSVEQLSQTSRDVTAKESDVKDKIAAVEKARKAIDDARTRNHQELRSFLGTIGYGRYLAFEEGLKGEFRGKARDRFTRKQEVPAAVPAAAAPATAAPSAPAPATQAPATTP